MQFWIDIMIDTKKRERFLSSFNAVEKDILFMPFHFYILPNKIFCQFYVVVKMLKYIIKNTKGILM